MTINKKDEQFRQFALTAHPLRLLIVVCGPLAVYQALQMVFKILDTLMASHVSSESVSAVAVLSQITLMITALGTGLAVGGCIKISEAYGQGDYDLVKQRTSTLYALAVSISLIVAVVLIPFAAPFLRLLKTPEDLIRVGTGYFRVEIVTLIVTFFNTVFIAVERSRGHSKQIMNLNLAVILVKLSLSWLFVYVLNFGVISIAVATLASQLTMLSFAAYRMPRDEGAFRFETSAIRMKWQTISPVFHLAYPVTCEKLFFAMGKVIVNSMAGLYGKTVAGALGISNNIGGLTTNWHMGMLDGASALISQNRGAKCYKRTLSLFYWLLVVDLAIGLIGYVTVTFSLPWLAQVFAQSKEVFDAEFCKQIVDIHRWEMIGYFTLAVNSAVNAFMLGYGYSKLTMILNTVRVFVFRIPVLWYLQNFTSVGAEAVGITMMVSNVATGILSVIIVLPVLHHIHKKYLKE